MRKLFCISLAALGSAALWASVVEIHFSAAAENNTADTAKADSAAPVQFDPELYQKTVQRGVDYLLNKGVKEDGSYSASISPAVTALCTAALIRSGRSPDASSTTPRSPTTTPSSPPPLGPRG